MRLRLSQHKQCETLIRFIPSSELFLYSPACAHRLSAGRPEYCQKSGPFVEQKIRPLLQQVRQEAEGIRNT
jgi:hypothetical protein